MTKIFNTLNGFYQYRINSIKIFAKVIIGNLEQFAFRIIQQIKNIVLNLHKHHQ